MKYSESCKNALRKIDYVSLLNAVIEDYSYDELVDNDEYRPNLLEIEEFKEMDKKIEVMLEYFSQQGTMINVWEQNERRKNSFKHIAINRQFQCENNRTKYRLYLCPDDKNLYYIVYELLKRCIKENKNIYIKYTRENRKDKLLIYLNNKKDLDEKIELLESIKKEYPVMFTNMDKSIAWLSESSFHGSYIAPEHFIKRFNGTEYNSYTQLFVSALSEMRTLLLFKFGLIEENDSNSLKKINKQELLDAFIPICLQVIGEYGMFLYLEDDNKLNLFINEKFPGINQPINEHICLSKKNNELEYGTRLKQNLFRYYKIPRFTEIPKDLSNSNLKYYDMDCNERIKRELYDDYR